MLIQIFKSSIYKEKLTIDGRIKCAGCCAKAEYGNSQILTSSGLVQWPPLAFRLSALQLIFHTET